MHVVHEREFRNAYEICPDITVNGAFRRHPNHPEISRNAQTSDMEENAEQCISSHIQKKKKMGPHQYGLCNDDEALFRCEIPTLNQRSNDRMIELKLGNNTIFMSKQNRPVDYASGPFGRSHLRFRACCKKGKTI